MSISIHAPREGGDIAPNNSSLKPNGNFNPRPPRGGRRLLHGLRPHMVNFNPRPPRGGRPSHVGHPRRHLHFNPRPPRGGRHNVNKLAGFNTQFQSTPPARGATQRCIAVIVQRPEFQSTPPARGATVRIAFLVFCALISIHAPREGGDYIPLKSSGGQFHFNPRPPRGGRLLAN